MGFVKNTHAGKMLIVGTMKMHGESLLVGVTKYQPPYDDRVAVLAVMPSGEIYGKLSVNIIELKMEPGEFVVSHDIPEKDRASMLHGGAQIEDTGKRASYGFVQDQPVFRVIGEFGVPA